MEHGAAVMDLSQWRIGLIEKRKGELNGTGAKKRKDRRAG